MPTPPYFYFFLRVRSMSLFEPIGPDNKFEVWINED